MTKKLHAVNAVEVAPDAGMEPDLVEFGLDAVRAARSVAGPVRHLKVTGASPAFGFERCEDPGCLVGSDGTASSCGRLACPICGCGGTNLTTLTLVDAGADVRLRCSCGHAWTRSDLHPQTLATHAV